MPIALKYVITSLITRLPQSSCNDNFSFSNRCFQSIFPHILQNRALQQHVSDAKRFHFTQATHRLLCTYSHRRHIRCCVRIHTGRTSVALYVFTPATHPLLCTCSHRQHIRCSARIHTGDPSVYVYILTPVTHFFF